MNSIQQLFADCLSADEILTDNHRIHHLLTDQRGRYHGSADVVLQPENVSSVQKILKICSEHHISVTPQGGNTSLCGAATPEKGVLLLLHRLNRIREINATDATITVEAGAILADVQQAAKRAGWFFPLSLASEGSCQIGGNLACNAGGLNVVRYGTASALTLGLEVVLPDGSLISHLSPLHKNTTGLNLLPLFIGSEGTLGVITAATLKLFRLHENTTATLWVNVAHLHQCLDLLRLMRQLCGEKIKTFELISENALSLVMRDLKTQSPTGDVSGWHILCEWEETSAEEIQQIAQCLLENGYNNTLLAQNQQQRQQWWRLREHISQAQKKRGFSIKHDIALPINRLVDFIESNIPKIQHHFPQAEVILFGHLGDGSLHYNVFLPDHLDQSVYQFEQEINELVYASVLDHQGTIAAEHGIGVLKRAYLTQMKTPAELALMQAIKRQLDPKNIMNPNKVYPF
ncbi:MAG: FAD-binding oxidoreductase [Neisseriaceae bacterium]|nr:FAD-binding oxidoreductase [Neisseriaceae bacterium]